MEMGIWYKENVLQGRGLQQSVQPKAGDVAVMKSRLWSCAAGRLLNVGLVCLTWFEMQLGFHGEPATVQPRCPAQHRAESALQSRKCLTKLCWGCPPSQWKLRAGDVCCSCWSLEQVCGRVLVCPICWSVQKSEMKSCFVAVTAVLMANRWVCWLMLGNLWLFLNGSLTKTDLVLSKGEKLGHKREMMNGSSYKCFSR